MKKWIAIGSVLTVLWVLVRGATLGSLLNETLIGLGVGFIIAYTLRNMYSGEIDLKHWVSITPAILYYLWSFTRELVLANLDVAKKVILPGESIKPDIVEVDLRVENPAAVSILANSITLTPGTLTMDHNEDKNSLYVHSITGKSDREDFISTVRDWEDLLLKIFTNQRNHTIENER